MDPTQTLNENTEDVIDVKSKGLINGKKIGVKRKDNVNVNNAQRKKSKNGLNQNGSINNAVVDEKKAKLPMNLRLEKLAAAYRTIIELVGEDPNREGVLKTPMRAAKAMLTFTQGYGMDLTTHSEAIFTEKDCDDMVVVRDIHISSLCEHHLVPFIGKCHIGYLPNGRVLGLSKFCRIADMYSQRLQVQERLTRNIAEALMDILKPRGVAVVIEASHMCMVMRGVRQHSANTVTSTVLGEFREKDRTRAEFLSIIKGNSFSSVR